MLEFHNVEVSDLRRCVIASRNAMRLELPDYNSEEEFEKGLKRAKLLVQASKNDDNVKCHDNFLTGIRVSFDMVYEQYITKQFQRYHWFDYVSSSSLMHRITKMDFSKCCNKYVSQETVDKMNKLIEQYNKFVIDNTEEYDFKLRDDIVHASTHSEVLYRQFMIIISECPMGAELFVHVNTNYKQLQTIYWQRKNHKLKEDYAAFFEMVEALPYAKELIIGEKENEGE